MSGKRKSKLTVKKKLEIIDELSRPKPPSKRSLARRYDVSEGAIRYIWINRKTISDSAFKLSDNLINSISRSTKPQYADLEEKLYSWVETLRFAKIPISPSLVISKAKGIAEQLSYSTDFKASWCWYGKFKKRKGLNQKALHGEGGEVDQNDPNTLAALELLYQEIAQYDPEDVYNMDETGLFFRVLPKYTVLLPEEDIKTARGRKNAKERVTLVACTSATKITQNPLVHDW